MFSSLGFIIMFITIIICTFIPYTFAADEGGTPRRLQRGSSSRSQQISNERGTPRSVERRLREIMSQHQQMSGEPEYQPTDVGSPRTAGRRRREPRSQPQQMSGELGLQPTGTPRSVERRLRETMLQHRQMSGEPEYQPTDVGSPRTPGRRRREPRSQRQQMSGELDLQPTVTPGWMGQGWSSQRQQISDDTEYQTQYQTPLQYTDQGTQEWMQQGWPSQQQQISDDTEYQTQYQTPLQYTDQGTLGWMEQGWSSQHQQIDDDFLLQYQSQLQLTDNAPVVSIRKMERGSSSRSQQFTSAPDGEAVCLEEMSKFFGVNPTPLDCIQTTIRHIKIDDVYNDDVREYILTMFTKTAHGFIQDVDFFCATRGVECMNYLYKFKNDHFTGTHIASAFYLHRMRRPPVIVEVDGEEVQQEVEELNDNIHDQYSYGGLYLEHVAENIGIRPGTRMPNSVNFCRTKYGYNPAR